MNENTSRIEHLKARVEQAEKDTLLVSRHVLDSRGAPAGGYSRTEGAKVYWQNGPLKMPDGTSRARNGAFVEEVLLIVADRLLHYQEGKFACRENALALKHIEGALLALELRTAQRVQQGVEGTHQPHN
jgi:hypothetical protein